MSIQWINITEKTGKLIAIKEVTDTDDLMIINKSGIAIRMPVTDMRVMGRATQGVRVIRIDEKDDIADVAVIPPEDDDLDDEMTENDSPENGTLENNSEETGPSDD